LGKTTLIRVLTTLLAADSGRARVAGLDVRKDARAIRSLIGLAGQYPTVDELLTGRENLELIGLLYHLDKLLYHLDKAVYRRRAQDALERMSLSGAGDNQVKICSGGMRRRLDLATSLIGRPPVLFLDEPTTGLDPRTRNDLWQFIEVLLTEGTTVLLTTQWPSRSKEAPECSSRPGERSTTQASNWRTWGSGGPRFTASSWRSPATRARQATTQARDRTRQRQPNDRHRNQAARGQGRTVYPEARRPRHPGHHQDAYGPDGRSCTSCFVMLSRTPSLARRRGRGY
jgi:ABC-type transport system involved in cytochrome c biogenesis ATPase subunit